MGEFLMNSREIDKEKENLSSPLFICYRHNHIWQPLILARSNI